MTKRVLFICIVFVVLLTTFGFLNDHVLRLESTSNGHQLPIIVIGSLFIFVLLVNPLLGFLGKSKMFHSAELAVLVAIGSCACGIGGRALMEQFTQIVALPHYWVPTNPGWTQRDVLSLFPKEALVDPEPFEDVISKFVTGSETYGVRNERFSDKVRRWFDQVPWRQWRGPLMTWMPFVVLLNIAMTALALIVHRQWSENEHLQYPVAEFASTLLGRDENRLLPSIFYSKLFWIGFTIVFLLRLNNGLHQWFPEYVIPVKMNHSFWAFANKWPILRRSSACWSVMRVNIFPLATAIAFFLSSEISLSIGLTQIIWSVLSIIVVTYGVSVSTDYDIGGYQAWTREGAYVAYGLLLAYSGRHYYWNVIRRAFYLGRGGGQSNEVDNWTVIAARLLVISVVLLCVLSIRFGLSWPLSISTILLMMLTFLIVARISAETGLLFIQPGWQPFGMVMVLFGGYAAGPTGIALSGLLCAILCIDQSQALLPYLTNGLKLCERNRVSLPKVAYTNLWIYLFGIAVCVVMGIVVSYEVGTTTYYPEWSFKRLPTMAIRAADPVALKLQAVGLLESSEALTGWERLMNIRPEPLFLWAAGTGFVCVVVCHFLRLRTTWWAIHPCLFLTWCTAPINAFAWPFLMGWFIKKLCLRFGGQQLVMRWRTVAIGVIAGEIMGAMLFMAIGAIYYFATGEQPKTYRFFPR